MYSVLCSHDDVDPNYEVPTAISPSRLSSVKAPATSSDDEYAKLQPNGTAVSTKGTSYSSLDHTTQCNDYSSLDRKPLAPGDSDTYDHLNQRAGAPSSWKQSEYSHLSLGTRSLSLSQAPRKPEATYASLQRPASVAGEGVSKMATAQGLQRSADSDYSHLAADWSSLKPPEHLTGRKTMPALEESGRTLM